MECHRIHHYRRHLKKNKLVVSDFCETDLNAKWIQKTSQIAKGEKIVVSDLQTHLNSEKIQKPFEPSEIHKSKKLVNCSISDIETNLNLEEIQESSEQPEIDDPVKVNYPDDPALWPAVITEEMQEHFLLHKPNQFMSEIHKSK